MTSSRRRFLALLLPPTLWLAAFLLLPTALLAAAALSPEGLRLLARPTTWELLARSLGMAALATALCLVLAYPAAYFIAGCPPRRRNLLLFLVVLPFWTNLLVRVYALKTILPAGFLNTPGAVLFGLVHTFLPFMILPLYGSIEKLPRRLLEASQDLGASPWQTFWKVTVPLTRAGIGAGCILVFIPAAGIFALPELLGGASTPLVGNQIELFFKKNPNSAAGSALTLVLLALTGLLAWAYIRLRRSEGLA
jgi:spermidine/putrescine transport system permease protein